MREAAGIATLLVMLTPTVTLAMGCSGAHKMEAETASISCAEGMSYDAEAKKCVEMVG
ncbi:hypothetical protein [Pseudaestuariivita sp.]|uniref:hypothetical protein n=1 Tax=Pseudaestuariivita sp. TaxID=2211669 RepID=UPI004059B7D5